MLLPGSERQDISFAPMQSVGACVAWENAAERSASYIWMIHKYYSSHPVSNHTLNIKNKKSEIDNLRLSIDEYIKTDLYLEKIEIGDKRDLFRHKALWLAMAYNSIDAIKVMFNKEVDIKDIVNVVIGKQKDYGHKNIEMFAITGLVIRVHDKIARAENIMKKPGMLNDVPGESMLDTFVDIIGYSIIAMMWLEGTFMLPLQGVYEKANAQASTI